MKTLLVTFDYPPMVGGIATVFGTLWRRAADDNALVLAPSAAGDEAFDAHTAARTVRFPTLSGNGLVAKAINALTCSLWFTALTLRHRPALVIAGQIRRAGPLAHAWSRITGKPFDLWVYGGETSADFAAPRTARSMQRILTAARYVFTNSPYTTHEMVDFGLPAQRVVEMPLGVREDLQPAAKDPVYVQRLGLAGKLVFLTVGRLIERKGIDTMLQALAAADGRLPPWHYLVVSDGPYRAALETQCRDLGLQDKVTFTGFVEDDEMPIYYNLCDVFAMPNRAVKGASGTSLSVEGFGIVLIDAAACGKPVIAGRSGGAVYAVDDGVNGILVEPGDVDSLQQALLRLADPDVRAAMGGAGIAFAARFQWDATAARLRSYL